MKDDCMPTRESSGCSLETGSEVTDTELQVLAAIICQLSRLDRAGRERAIVYLMSRYNSGPR